MDINSVVVEYLEYCRYRKELDENTVKAYGIDLGQYAEQVRCLHPEKEQIEEYLTDLHKKYKQKTVKRKIASLHTFYSYLEENELIKDNPFLRIRIKFKEDMILPRIIPRKEIERLLNGAYGVLSEAEGTQYLTVIRDIAVIELLFATGARVYEVSNITAGAIDVDTGIIQIMGKGGKERYVQIGDEKVLLLLRRYHDLYEAKIGESGFFFVNRNGDRFREQSIRDMLKRYAKKAAIERTITPHMFRHSVATYLIEEDVDISCVQQILGHSSLRTTQLYLHVSTGKQAKIMQTKHPRNKMHITEPLFD